MVDGLTLRDAPPDRILTREMHTSERVGHGLHGRNRTHLLVQLPEKLMLLVAKGVVVPMFHLVEAGFSQAMGITRERGRFVTAVGQ